MDETFGKDAATGTWDEADQSQSAYTGKSGVRWFTAPSTVADGYGNPYSPENTVSVHDGVLDINPQTVNGSPAGALVTPALDGTTPYQTYGKYSVTLNTSNVDNPYRLTVALYPKSGDPSTDGEAIFPDSILNQAANVNGYYIYGGTSCTDTGCIAQSTPLSTFSTTTSHTYTVQWTPTELIYTVDKQVVLDQKTNIPTKPMRFQIAVNSTPLNNVTTDTNDTHVLISDVHIWKYTK